MRIYPPFFSLTPLTQAPPEVEQRGNEGRLEREMRKGIRKRK